MNIDVVVIGGGTAGVAAAYEAASNGLSVVVVEQGLSLGGTATQGLVSPMMPSYTVRRRYLNELMASLHDQIMDYNEAVWFSPQDLAFAQEEMLKKLGVKIMYQAVLVDVVKVDHVIKSVDVISFNQRRTLEATHFIDATGDAWLGRLAGVEVASGDENGKNQSTSFRMEVANIDIERLMDWSKKQDYTFSDCKDVQRFEFVHVPNLKSCGKLLDIFSEAVEKGLLDPVDIRYIQGFAIKAKPRLLSFNAPQLENIGPSTDCDVLSSYVTTGRKMQHKLHHFLKHNIPGFEESYIASEATLLGVRESYRIVGQYVLTEHDYVQRRKFDDGVVPGDWYVDIHQDDLDVEDESFKLKYEQGEFYEIPYRCFIVDDVNNYIAVGRHISTTFKMQSSIRIQRTVQMMGEVAGYACFLASKNHQNLNQLDGKSIKEWTYENNR